VTLLLGRNSKAELTGADPITLLYILLGNNKFMVSIEAADTEFTNKIICN